MNENEKIDPAIDASCRVPLLASFGGAAWWLVVGLALAMLASLNFHMPGMFSDHGWLAYGRVPGRGGERCDSFMDLRCLPRWGSSSGYLRV